MNAVKSEASALYKEVEPDLKSADPEKVKIAKWKLDDYLCKEVNVSTEITLGSKVVIKECHSMPQLIGKTGVVKALLMVDATNPYPMYVWLDEPIQMSQALPIPGVSIQQEWRGPHLCRPDELALVGSEQTNIPDAFNKAFDEKPPEEKKDDGSSK